MTLRKDANSLFLAELSVPIGLEPMEARLVENLPTEPGWEFEPKWDGFRCLALRSSDEVDLRAKSGKPLARYFPEIVANLTALPSRRFVIDGELVIPTGGNLSFEALQMRLHPAESRVRRLLTDGEGWDCCYPPRRDRGAKVADLYPIGNSQ